MIDQWFAEYSADLLTYAQSRGLSREDAEDICGQVFLEAIKNPPAIAPRAWFFGRTQARIIDYWRRVRRRGVDAPIDEQTAMVEPPNVSDLGATLSQALSELPSGWRKVIVARFVDDRSIAEIAEAKGISHGAVKALQHRAITALRAQRDWSVWG